MRKPTGGFPIRQGLLKIRRRSIFKNDNLFEIVKRNITTRQAAEAYGFQPNRSSMICCPFHTDRNPSMKVDSRFHCFGCGADGDVIDFTAKLFQLSLRRAAEKLVADFGLSMNPVFPLQYPKIVEYKSQNPIQTLYECSAILDDWRKRFAPKSAEEELHPCFVASLHYTDYIQYLIENRHFFPNIGRRFNRLPNESENTRSTISNIRKMLSQAEKGGVQNTIQNCVTVLQNDPILADSIRLNLLSERIDIVKPMGWQRSGPTLTDTDMMYILRRMEKYGLYSEKRVSAAIRIVANENHYHPIRDYLNDLKWDGVERISHALHRFLGAAEDELTAEALKIFLLGAIKRVFHPGCKFEMMLCLVGGQGAGKSSFFRLLAIKDEWFSDDLRRLDDDNVFRKLQGHWIMEMSEMIATANAKSIEEIKSFLSKQKETYKIPYETHPADRLRQCVFAGTTNRQDFLPRDRTGNRRFIPIPVDAAQAEVHILDNEAESRAYIDQLWAEAMTIYNSGDYKLTFSPAMQEALQICQKDFMQEDTQAGMIYAFLEDYTGDRVCSKQLYAEALGNLNLPAEWETRAICEIMTAGIVNGEIKGWTAHKAAKRYPKYGVQKGWERVTAAKVEADGFVELTDEEAQQMGFPF